MKWQIWIESKERILPDYNYMSATGAIYIREAYTRADAYWESFQKALEQPGVTLLGVIKPCETPLHVAEDLYTKNTWLELGRLFASLVNLKDYQDEHLLRVVEMCRWYPHENSNIAYKFLDDLREGSPADIYGAIKRYPYDAHLVRLLAHLCYLGKAQYPLQRMTSMFRRYLT